MTPPPKDYVDGLTRLAATIAAHFDIPCVKQDITKWRKFTPPFPSPNPGSNRYKLPECLEWVEVYWLPKKRPGEAEQKELFLQAMIADAQLKIRKDQEHAFNFDVEKKKYITQPIAELAIMGFAKRYHAWVRLEMERNLTTERKSKLESLGVSAEAVAAFYQFDLLQAVSAIGRIETECENFSKEAAGELTA
jgi:hypothetical protein